MRHFSLPIRTALALRLLCCAALLLEACSSAPGNGYRPRHESYRPLHATGFALFAEADSSSVLQIRTPWGGSDSCTYYFLSRGGELPPEGFQGTLLPRSPERIVCMSSTYVAMLDAVGQSHRIVGVSGADYLSNPEVHRRYLDGRVHEVGYDANLNFELLAAMKTDLVLLYGIGGENTAVTGKLREMGIPYIYMGEYLEQSPLAKAEWMVVIGELTGRRKMAEEAFRTAAARYDSLCSLAARAEKRPAVMLNAPYKDTWHFPTPSSYMARFITDAGGDYVWTGGDSSTESTPVSLEQAYLLAQRSQVWLNPGQYASLEALLADNPRFAQTPPAVARRVYNNNRRTTPAGGSDFWESGVVLPHVVLKDLIFILHPELIEAGYEPYFYTRL